jgi:hypothetical protein
MAITTIQLRRGTASDLSSVVLASGEPGFATDSNAFKVGDGSTTFSNLAGYVKSDKDGISGTVSGVNNILIMDQTTYNGLTKDPNTVYIVPT